MTARPFDQLLKAVQFPTLASILRPIGRRAQKRACKDRCCSTPRLARNNHVVLLLDVANMLGDVTGVCEALLRHHKNQEHRCRLSVCAFVERGAEVRYDASLREFLLAVFADSLDSSTDGSTTTTTAAAFLSSSHTTEVMLRRLALLPSIARKDCDETFRDDMITPTSRRLPSGHDGGPQRGRCGATFSASWREVTLDANRDAADLQVAAYAALLYHQQRRYVEHNGSAADFVAHDVELTEPTSLCPSCCIVVTNDLRFWRGFSPLFPSSFLSRVSTDLEGLSDEISKFSESKS
jgi:hypothetical protein